MKKQKEISLSRRDIVTAYTLLRLCVGLLLLANGLAEIINSNLGFKILILAFSDDYFSVFLALSRVYFGTLITLGFVS